MMYNTANTTIIGRLQESKLKRLIIFRNFSKLSATSQSSHRSMGRSETLSRPSVFSTFFCPLTPSTTISISSSTRIPCLHCFRLSSVDANPLRLHPRLLHPNPLSLPATGKQKQSAESSAFWTVPPGSVPRTLCTKHAVLTRSSKRLKRKPMPRELRMLHLQPQAKVRCT